MIILTAFEKVNSTAPIGIKTMPMTKKEIITGPGVNKGCHAFIRCCLKAVSIISKHCYLTGRLGQINRHGLLSGFLAEDLLLVNIILCYGCGLFD
jgi:hypothetical protein